MSSRGREDSLLFGKGEGSSGKGKYRSEVLRYAIDVTHDWKWKPNQLRDHSGEAREDCEVSLEERVTV